MPKIKGILERETDKALKITQGEGRGQISAWIPRSQCGYMCKRPEFGGQVGIEVDVPEWLAERSELYYE